MKNSTQNGCENITSPFDMFFQQLSIYFQSHHRLNLRGAIADVDNNSIDEASEGQARQKPPCYESIPCGWAHYTTSSNRFRPIYHYTKNTM